MIKINPKTGDVTHDYTPEKIKMLQKEIVKNWTKLPEEEKKDDEIQ